MPSPVVRYYRDCSLPLRSELVNHNAKDSLQCIRASPRSELLATITIIFGVAAYGCTGMVQTAWGENGSVEAMKCRVLLFRLVEPFAFHGHSFFPFYH